MNQLITRLNLQYIAFLIGVVTIIPSVYGNEPKLEGTPGELASYLDGISKTVKLHGHGEIKAQADIVIASLKVKTKNSSLGKAIELNQDRIESIIKHLTKGNIKKKDIIPTKFSWTPEDGYISKAYHVVNIVKVKIVNESQFRLIAKQVDSSSDVTFAGLAFEHSLAEKFKQDVLIKACDSVVMRKDIFTKAIGVSLTPINFLDSGVVVTSVTDRSEAAYNKAQYNSDKMHKSLSSFSLASSSYGANFGSRSFGEIIYTATVQVEYAVKSN